MANRFRLQESPDLVVTPRTVTRKSKDGEKVSETHAHILKAGVDIGAYARSLGSNARKAGLLGLSDLAITLGENALMIADETNRLVNEVGEVYKVTHDHGIKGVDTDRLAKTITKAADKAKQIRVSDLLKLKTA